MIDWPAAPPSRHGTSMAGRGAGTRCATAGSPARCSGAGRRLPADPAGRAAASPRAVRSRRRVRLLAGAARLRAARAVRAPREGAADEPRSSRRRARSDAEAATQRLLDGGGLAAARRAARRGRLRPGPLGAAMVGNAPLAAMIEHHAAFYADLADPVALLRGEGRAGALAALLALCGHATRRHRWRPSACMAYSALMAASQALVADEVLDAYRLHGASCLLDVGGGEGAFLLAAARRAPRLRLHAVRPAGRGRRARARFARPGCRPVRSAIGGDFRVDPLPRGADVDLAGARPARPRRRAALRLLRAVHAALPPGGTLLLAEPMAGTRGRRADGRRLFRLLPARDGARPAAPARRTDADAARGRLRRDARAADPGAAADRPARRTAVVSRF